MSLLLDALKKAAEKKAQKNADNKSVDHTELTRTQLAEDAPVDETSIDKTVAVTETRVDTTRIDKTELDATQLDATDIDKTHLDTTRLDSTTHLDRTEIDSTSVKEATHAEPPKPEKPVSESTQEMDVRELDLSRLAREHAEEEAKKAAQEAEDEKTLSFIDDEEISLDGLDSDDNDYDSTEDETLVLTPDDITEFMGDGRPPEPARVQETAVPPPIHVEGSDDTTITNSDSLSLTNIDQDGLDLEPMEQGYPMAQDETRTESATYGRFDGRLSLEAEDDENSAGMSEDDYPTVMNADTTAPSVDIEKLTNDETVTIKDSTYTRTFAPDNYDRTLMKLSDQDVSRIFPGMKSETDTVMTPDYAKKIFITKSRGVKNYYYKVYAGVALCILLIVVMWGLFEIQTESESIDNNLLALKRDPMPGVIKPKNPEGPTNLFSTTPQVDNQAIKVIEKASAEEQGLSEAEQMDESSDRTPAQGSISTDGHSVQAGLSSSSSNAAPRTVAAESAKTASTKTAPSGSAADSRPAALSISSNSRISEKDQILAEAYEAYEAGRLDAARRQYQQVLALDAENRDALLGRAAIHVLDNQYQEAISLYQKLLLANPKDDLAMTSLISVASVDPQAGETELKKLLNDLPESPYLHFALGNMYGSQNRWAEAQSEYFKALQYKPGDPNYAYNLAISLEHMQKPANAVTFYQKALDNKSNALTTFNESLVMQRIEVLSQ